MNWTIGKKLIAFVSLSIFALTVILSTVNYITTKNSLIESAQHKLISDLQLGYQYLDFRFPGDWNVTDGVLYKGNVEINENYEIVDKISELTGGNSVTIFLYDTRVTTNVVTNEGVRAIGSKVSDEIKESVLDKGARFIGRADVVGVWNQTAYDPILNKNGDVIGIWYTGVPEQPYNEIALKGSFLNIGIAGVIMFSIFVISYFYLNQMIIKPLKMLTEFANKIANLELNGKSFNPKKNDEISQLGKSFTKMKENLYKIVQNLIESSDSVTDASTSLSASAKQTEESATQIASAVQEIAAGASEQTDHTKEIIKMMEASVNKVEEGLQQASDTLMFSKKSTQSAYDGNNAITNAIKHLEKITKSVEASTENVNNLGKRSEEIGSIITTITSIADQTNLLALNAAIEAARAGEHGKGFAVVADEVRKLAEESSKSAGQITALIQSIQADTNVTVEFMEKNLKDVHEQVQIIEKGQNSLKEIVQQTEMTEQSALSTNQVFNELKDNAEQTLGAVKEISSIIEQTSASTEEVSASTEEQTATVEEISANAEQLAKMSENLQTQINHFKL
ncbi:hypothetical protein BKP45_13405 [Anaerobacillus alkalidiazotrophicus]|uniref:Methyl-accepting chemotaxis protein n=1 Tax=Anaerobacillus alkalidiazotrophicus TaxID=472963 RepID=A0A1S2M499_9BACI|nr:methyl-accepting chemotaxis protein [Anaerobacillus alkalidiazotrophicus]OIJ19436.1 hypothetical protein BKP45_13405 [Anaerobacillus alkalidiazotrophicus]